MRKSECVRLVRLEKGNREREESDKELESVWAREGGRAFRFTLNLNSAGKLSHEKEFFLMELFR